MAESKTESQPAEGVQDLIHRIRDEGVQAGKQEARDILRKARGKAERLGADAKAEAEALLADSRATLTREKEAAEEALKLAARDAARTLGREVRAAFEAHVKRLVSLNLEDRAFLKDVILGLAGKTGARLEETGKAVEILVHDKDAAGDESTRAAGEERIRKLILGITGDMLREGVEIKPAGESGLGASVRIEGEDLRIDLTDEAISELLVRELLPRYRRIVSGIE